MGCWWRCHPREKKMTRRFVMAALCFWLNIFEERPPQVLLEITTCNVQQIKCVFVCGVSRRHKSWLSHPSFFLFLIKSCRICLFHGGRCDHCLSRQKKKRTKHVYFGSWILLMDSSKLMKIRGSSGGGWWATLLLDGLLLVWLPSFILSWTEQNTHVRPASNLRRRVWPFENDSLFSSVWSGGKKKIQKLIWGLKLLETFSQLSSRCSCNTFTSRYCMGKWGRDQAADDISISTELLWPFTEGKNPACCLWNEVE